MGNGSGQCDIPPLPEGRRYIAAAAGSNHTVLVRDDGEAFCFGQNGNGQCNVPPRPEGGRYVAANAGMVHTILWTEFGDIVAFGGNDDGRCSVPEGVKARVVIPKCFLEAETSSKVPPSAKSSKAPPSTTNSKEIPAHDGDEAVSDDKAG